MYLIITGILIPPWKKSEIYHDSFGNPIKLGSWLYILSFSLGWLSLLKNVVDSFQCVELVDSLTVLTFVLPTVIFRVYSYVLLLTQVREWILSLLSLLFIVNFFITAQFAPDENGINISSTAFCSIFSVVSMCKDPTRKERLGITGMDVPTLKKMTLTITAVSLPLTAGACWAAYFVLPKYMNLGDPNSSLTFQQELYLLTYPYMGLLGLCGVSLLLFYYLFNRYF